MSKYILSTDSKQTHKYSIEILSSTKFIKEVRTVFNNIGELYLNNRTLYKKLVQNNLLYSYFPNEKYTDEYWNEKTCCEISRIFTNVEDFYRCYPKAYEIAEYNNWIHSYTWIKDRDKHPNFYWSKERIKHLIDTKLIQYRTSLAKCEPGAFKAAKINNWLNDLFPEKCKSLLWDENACYELALTCHNISEMAEKSSKAAKYARENGWVEQYTWFDNYIENLKDFKYCIYVYTDGIAAYIGLTRDYRIKGRHREHNQKKNGKYDALKTYFNNKGEELPMPIILLNDLTPEYAQYYENYYKEKYESDGYLILNKAPTGSLGGGYFRHSKEECETIAKKYNTLTDFYKNEEPIYSAAKLHGWLKDYTWLERREQEFVSYEEAYEEAKKYKYFGEFATKAQRQYNAAYKKSWLKDYTWLEYKNSNRNYERPKPTREECFENARRFDKAKLFYNHKTTMCKYAREQGWYNDYIWFDSVYRYWTFIRCEEEARKYKTFKEFEENCYGGYHVSVEEGWISKFDWLA